MRPLFLRLWIVLCFSGLVLGPQLSLGSQVYEVSEDQVQVLVTPKTSSPWIPGEAACVTRKGKRLACGKVEDSNVFGARITITLTSGQDIVFGDWVKQTKETSQVYHILTGEKKIVITHRPNRRWRKGEAVCVFREKVMMACGEVVRTDKLTAEVDIEMYQGKAVTEGDSIKEAPGRSKVVEVILEKNQFRMSQLKNRPWETMDKVEVLHEGEPIAVAIVTRTDRLTAMAHLIKLRKNIESGDWVRIEQRPTLVKEQKPTPVLKTNRNVSSVVSKVSTKMGDCIMFFFEGVGSCSSNLSIGMNHFNPTIRYEMAFHRTYSVGLMPVYFNFSSGGTSLGGFGIFATLAYYRRHAYKGLWLQLGVGLSSLMATENNVKNGIFTPMVYSTMGWRWLWDSGLNLGVGLGANYFMNLKTETVRLSFSGLLPAISVDMGYKF